MENGTDMHLAFDRVVDHAIDKVDHIVPFFFSAKESREN